MKHGLSNRGRKLLASPPIPEYIQEHFALAGEPWDPVSNPDGYISMGVAENKLTWDLLEPKMAECREITQSAVGYDAMIGSFPFREELARFMGRTFLGRAISPSSSRSSLERGRCWSSSSMQSVIPVTGCWSRPPATQVSGRISRPGISWRSSR